MHDAAHSNNLLIHLPYLRRIELTPRSAALVGTLPTTPSRARAAHWVTAALSETSNVAARSGGPSHRASTQPERHEQLAGKGVRLPLAALERPDGVGTHDRAPEG